MSKQQRDEYGRFLSVDKPAQAVKFKGEDKPSAAQASRLRNSRTSFAVNYVRTKDLANGAVTANKRNPSVRRFGTAEEAQHHALRFVEKQGHLGFYITSAKARPNAWVNEKTGLTNPEIAR